ncbi:DUF4233 domain-containing protein [Ornithinimicrobium sp. Y1847]|uniref:DUF4233 domain-containing protein n=1 Tax=Ornithinimicrobium sp. Y1847 TaxID=3405419 RepID=UPI003B680CDD
MNAPAHSQAPARTAPGPMVRRLAGATLIAQAMSVFFGAMAAWQLDAAHGGETGMRNLWLIGALAVLCLVAAGMLRSRTGIILGWAAQVLTLLSAIILPAMAIVALIFGSLWWLCLHHGGRIDSDRARWAAEAQAGAAETSDPQAETSTHEER